MSDIEAKIESVLEKVETDTNNVSKQLTYLLQAPSIDALSVEEQDDTKSSVPYVLSAYALSSLLFAYLRSEGKDTAMVLPQLAGVKEKMEKVNAALRDSSKSESAGSSKVAKPKKKKSQKSKKQASPK